MTAKEISEALAEQHQVEIAKTKLVLDEPIKPAAAIRSAPSWAMRSPGPST